MEGSKEDEEKIAELREKELALRKAAAILSVDEADLPRTIERFLKELD